MNHHPAFALRSVWAGTEKVPNLSCLVCDPCRLLTPELDDCIWLLLGHRAAFLQKGGESASDSHVFRHLHVKPFNEAAKFAWRCGRGLGEPCYRSRRSRRSFHLMSHLIEMSNITTGQTTNSRDRTLTG